MNKLIFVLLLAFAPLTLLAQRQTSEALVNERKAAEAQIARIDAQLNELKGTKQDASEQLRLTKERLSKRHEVLRSIDAQISILDDRAREQSSLATAHTASLDSMYRCYEKTVCRLFSNGQNIADFGLLLPTNAAKKYVQHRHLATVLLRAIENRSKQIRSIQGELGFELRQIAERKNQLALLKSDEAVATAEIERERAKIENLTAKIAKDEKTLTSEKSRRVKLIADLQRQIENAIRREVEASQKPTSTTQQPAIKEDDPLSRAFVAGKGQMISPVTPAKVVDGYGVHEHPTQRGVKVDNKGINIQTTAGASVRSIAKGDVRKIFVVAGMGTSVLVRHGAYLTVYSNLQNVTVAVGQIIETGGLMGRVADDGILHFELWRETQTLNPMQWLNL